MDRNIPAVSPTWNELQSLSARRAWIEIAGLIACLLGAWGRSPQGERG